MTVRDIELTVSLYFQPRTNVIVPNVSWGFLYGREADMLVLTPRGWITEIEIKTSAADIKRDLQKRFGHWDRKVRQCWFAVPEKLAQSPDIPEHYGILSVSDAKFSLGRQEYHKIKAVRAPKINPEARKVTDKERLHLMHLGCMRIWTLKAALEKKKPSKAIAEIKYTLEL